MGLSSNLQLFGSTTSPYVRRIRLFLADRPYEFVNLDIFSTEGRAQLSANNPAKKVPFLIDGQQTIFDSGVIYRYLRQKYDQPSLSWAEENIITMIDAANDSLVSLLLCQRSGFDTRQDKLFFNLQYDRLETIFATLNDEVANGMFRQWQYPAMCLFCLLDWTEFRQLYDLGAFTSLIAFLVNAKRRAMVAATDPR